MDEKLAPGYPWSPRQMLEATNLQDYHAMPERVPFIIPVHDDVQKMDFATHPNVSIGKVNCACKRPDDTLLMISIIPGTDGEYCEISALNDKRTTQHVLVLYSAEALYTELQQLATDSASGTL
jgi:hypothetical protein